MNSNVTSIPMRAACLAVVALLGACLAVVALLGGCRQPQGGTASDAMGPPVVKVKTVVSLLQDVPRSTTQPASVHAYYRTEIHAKVSGYVQVLHADIGDHVDEGAALAEIDVPEMRKQRQVIEARIGSFQAQQQRATAGLNLAKANVQSSQAKLDEAKSLLDRAEASLAAADAELNRTRDLVQRQSLQQRMLDEVQMKRDSEAAGRQASRSAIRSAEADVTVAEAQVNSAEADVLVAGAATEIARRQLEELDVLLDYATLRAPFPGVVTGRGIEPGDLVNAADQRGHGDPLFVISQVDKVRIRILVPETDAPYINPGDRLTCWFPSFAGEAPIVGSVSRSSGDLDPSTRTMMVEAVIDNPDGKLIPGMFGEAKIDIATDVAITTLPARAIRFAEDGSAYVYALTADSTVNVVPVELGWDDGSTIEVVAGIEPGQQVIDAHLHRFTDGQQVNVLAN